MPIVSPHWDSQTQVYPSMIGVGFEKYEALYALGAAAGTVSDAVAAKESWYGMNSLQPDVCAFYDGARSVNAACTLYVSESHSDYDACGQEAEALTKAGVDVFYIPEGGTFTYNGYYSVSRQTGTPFVALQSDTAAQSLDGDQALCLVAYDYRYDSLLYAMVQDILEGRLFLGMYQGYGLENGAMTIVSGAAAGDDAWQAAQQAAQAVTAGSVLPAYSYDSLVAAYGSDFLNIGP